MFVVIYRPERRVHGVTASEQFSLGARVTRHAVPRVGQILAARDHRGVGRRPAFLRRRGEPQHRHRRENRGADGQLESPETTYRHFPAPQFGSLPQANGSG